MRARNPLTLVLAAALLGGDVPAHAVGQAVPPVPASTVRTVDAEGVAAIAGGDEARARDEALFDAYRRALEAAEVRIHARTEVRNYQVLLDAVTATGTGYLRSLAVLGERVDRGLYRVRVRADVALGDIAADREGLAVLVGLMDNPTVAVALDGPDPYAGAVETALSGQFAAAGYHVVHNAAVPAAAIKRMAAQDDRQATLLTSARAMADVLIVGTVDAASLGTVRIGTESVESAEATLHLRAVVGATGQTLFAGAPQARGLHVTPEGALRQAGRNLGEQLGGRLIWDVARAYGALTSGAKSLRVIVLARSYDRVARLLAQVRAVRGVAGRAYLRTYDGGVGVIDVRSDFPERILLPRLEALGLRVLAAQPDRVVVESRR